MPRQTPDRRAEQAAAFDRIGEHYDEAFPRKEGQLLVGQWLLRRLMTPARIVDIGCGTGLPSASQAAAAGHAVAAVDISASMLRLATRNVPRCGFIRADAMRLPLLRGSFDAAMAFFSLLMLARDDVPVALAALREVLKPGGWLALGMVEADLDDALITFLGVPIRVTGFPRDELSKVVIEAGFEVHAQEVRVYQAPAPEVPPETQLFLLCRRSVQ